MQTLAQLRSGELTDATHITLSENIQSFPQELFELTETLEVLDLSNNQMDTLPDDFYRFHKLRILFLSSNPFESFPAVLSQCPNLSMVGFKSCKIQHIPDHAFPKKLRWLILTDNRLETLPDSIGDCLQLQKLMLAGNRLRTLPTTMQQCQALELLRISANQLATLPAWLLNMPKLSWLAFAGNPCSQAPQAQELRSMHWDDLQHGHILGEGASGLISHALWQAYTPVALKEFKGDITSDGFPADEMAACMHIGKHPHLIEVLGKLEGHPEQKDGLILSLMREDFNNLASPPSLASCTRDIYAACHSFSLDQLLRIAIAIADAAQHLHARQWSHGDLYAHNISLNDDTHCLLGDFGAASCYQSKGAARGQAIERLEVRAFACLLEELLEHLDEKHRFESSTIIQQLADLQRDCCQANTQQRPRFHEIHLMLQHIATA